jgi:hypothetical protein
MFFFIVAVFTLKSCVNHEISDPSVEPTTDLSLFEQGTENSFTYYQNGNILQAESPSPHGQFKLRFNTIATTVLDATGELPADGKFPNGSIVVKEAYQNNALTGLIIIKKASTDANASNGWLWGFYSLDGVATISIEEKGSQCVGCHSSSPNRDLIRTFDLH